MNIIYYDSEGNLITMDYSKIFFLIDSSFENIHPRFGLPVLDFFSSDTNKATVKNYINILSNRFSDNDYKTGFWRELVKADQEAAIVRVSHKTPEMILELVAQANVFERCIGYCK